MKKSTGTAIVTVMGVALVGTAVFFYTRPAAAKSKAQQAFIVDPNCGSFLAKSDEEAKAAFIAAAIAVAPTPDSNAIAALKAMLKLMFPQCSWADPIPEGRTFVRGNGQYLKWGDIVSAVGDRTVQELRDIIDSVSGMQGSSPLPWVTEMVFGTGGCLTCAMGTGGETRSKTGYQGASDMVKAPTRGTGYLPPKLPSGWLSVETATFQPKKHGARRWFKPLEWPSDSSNVVPAILYLKSGAEQHEVMIELIHTSQTKYKGRIVPGMMGTGLLKMAKWLPVATREHPVDREPYWITLESLINGNIYQAVLWAAKGKLDPAMRPVQAEVREVGGGKLEARVIE